MPGFCSINLLFDFYFDCLTDVSFWVHWILVGPILFDPSLGLRRGGVFVSTGASRRVPSYVSTRRMFAAFVSVRECRLAGLARGGILMER